MFTRIVVPLDGSPFAEEALSVAEGLAKPLNIPIHLIRATEVYPVYYGGYIDYTGYAEKDQMTSDDASTYLGIVSERLQRDGHTVTFNVTRGAAADQITAAAEDDDLIVMSSHGRSGVVRWFMGSVAEDVMRRGKGSVLMHRVRAAQSAHPATASAAISLV